MRKKNSAYWQKRFELLNQQLLTIGEEAIPGMQAAYDLADQAIQQEISAFYARFAKENQMSYAEARKKLTSPERKAFQMDVSTYIRKGKQAGISKQWLKELENASTVYRVSRLQAIQVQIRQQIELLEAAKEQSLRQGLGRLYEEGYYRTIYELQKGLGVGTPFATLDEAKIGKVLAKPWAPDGKNFSSRIWGDDRTKLVHQLNTRFAQGMIRGEGANKIAADLSNVLGVSKKAAENLVLTESAFFAGAARRDGFQELGVTEYEFMATLSEKTCETCGMLDGKVFSLTEYAPGVTASPLHPRCRCTEVPHFDDEFTAGEERFARGPDGKAYTVPGNVGFDQWRNTYAKHTLPKVAKAPDTTLQEVLTGLLNGNQVLIPSEAIIEKVRIIAGQGSATEIRQAKNLVQDYGGEAWRWQKKTGTIKSKYYNFETHWYEYEGTQYRTKVKGGDDI